MNRSSFRFSIAFMLFACLCIAGYLAGNRVGFRKGYASGQAKRQSEDPYPKVYEVGALIQSIGQGAEASTNQPDYDSLIMAIQTSVFPDEWESLGGECTLGLIPQLETFVVNATSNVHERLETFLKDLSSVKLAVAEARVEQDDRQRRRTEWINSMLQPISDELDSDLILTGQDLDLVGVWDVQQYTPDGMRSISQYDFIDGDTVQIPTPDDPSEVISVWYIASPGSIVVAGRPYIAATTKQDALVLIPTSEPLSFLVATRKSD
jgi:hypothetical protein